MKSDEKKDLTPMQKKMLEAVRDFVQFENMPPTVRELGEQFDLKPSTVFAHIQALEKKGYIRKSPGKSRGILPIQEALPPEGIPVIGQIQAGPFNLAEQDLRDTIDLAPEYFGGGNLFALEVRGDSMQDAGIFDGDRVVVLPCNDADDGRIVVAMVDDEATVKRLRKYRSTIVLEPANHDYAPMVFTAETRHPRIIGKVVGLLRRF